MWLSEQNNSSKILPFVRLSLISRPRERVVPSNFGCATRFGIKADTVVVRTGISPSFMSQAGTVILSLIYGLLVCLGCLTFIIYRGTVASAFQAARQNTFHHTHDTQVSRFGGAGLACAFFTFYLLCTHFLPAATAVEARSRLGLFLTAFLMFAMGFIDDLHALGAKKKLVAQILISFLATQSGILIETFRNPITEQSYALGVWSVPITILWLVALTNLINLIDGIDALAGGIGLMLMGLLAYVLYGSGLMFYSLCVVAMTGALLSFLFFNFPPAKIYMGDGGAYLIGYLIGAFAITGAHKGSVAAALLAPLVALALPIIDTTLAITRRGLKGLPLFRPDRKHLHHRLLAIGLSRTRAVLLMHAISMVFLLLALGVIWSKGKWTPLLVGVGGVVLILMGRKFSFSRYWFGVGRLLGNNRNIRTHTRYALAMGYWLELEAERSESLEDFWSSFQLLNDRLGFQWVRVNFDGAQFFWSRNDEEVKPSKADLVLKVHFNVAKNYYIEFCAADKRMSNHLFDHLTEIAAEAWLKGTNQLAKDVDSNLAVWKAKVLPPVVSNDLSSNAETAIVDGAKPSPSGT